ncbi:unnamed protein product [Rangifer tarandus platyrhynchus]|uniref:Uncharacterized protein n=2 Tax=Rangifer tarandus platyrhynchus TaxID=3082113 RepID=A0ACB1KHK5_RANTA|nr:unnamed protein product [Rangifer tarandus platyrhynchus]
MRESSRKNVLEKETLYYFRQSSDVHRDLEGSLALDPSLTRAVLYVHAVERHSAFKDGEQGTSRAVQRLQASAAGAKESIPGWETERNTTQNRQTPSSTQLKSKRIGTAEPKRLRRPRSLHFALRTLENELRNEQHTHEPTAAGRGVPPAMSTASLLKLWRVS